MEEHSVLSHILAPNKAWILILPIKTNTSLIMKNVIAEKPNLDHIGCHKVKQMTITANTGKVQGGGMLSLSCTLHFLPF